MPTYHVEVDGRIITIEAPTPGAAADAARQHLQQQRAGEGGFEMTPAIQEGLNPAPYQPGGPLPTINPPPAMRPDPFIPDPNAGAVHQPTVPPQGPSINRMFEWGQEDVDALATIGHGAGLALTDEAAGVIGGVGNLFGEGGFPAGYTAARQGYLDRVGAQYARDADAATGMEIGGGLLTGIGLGPALSRILPVGRGAATVPALAARTGLEGTIYGAIYGFGAGDTIEERLDNALSTGWRSGAASTVLGIPLAAIARARMNRNAAMPSFRGTSSARLADDNPVRQAGNELYALMRAEGALFNQQSVVGLRGRIFQAAMDALPEYRAAVLAGRWDEIPSNVRDMLQMASTIRTNAATVNPATGMDELDVLRQFIMDSLPTNASPQAARIAAAMRSEIDNFINTADATMMVGNVHPQRAGELLLQARSTWSDLMTAEDVNQAFYRAANTRGNRAEAIQAQFENLANDLRFMDSLSDAQRTAVLQVARGTNIERGLEAILNLMPNNALTLTVLMGGASGAGIAANMGGQLASIGTYAAIGAAIPALVRAFLGVARAGARRNTMINAENLFRNRGIPLVFNMAETGLAGGAGGAIPPAAFNNALPYVPPQ